jgi:hypothetical protein
MSNDLTNDKGQELFGKVGIEFADCRKMPQTADLLGFPAGIARGQSLPSLQFADRVGTAEPLRQQVDDRRIDILSMLSRRSRSLETGSAVSAITPSLSRSASAWIAGGKTVVTPCFEARTALAKPSSAKTGRGVSA